MILKATICAVIVVPIPEPKITPPKKLQLNKLGKTTLDLSAISIGTGSGPSAQVIKYAIKSGVNFIHTSVNYAGKKAIKEVAEAIKGQRDKVILGLKITWDPEDDKAMDNALKTLGVDSVDIAFFNIHKADDVNKDKYRKAAERWIKAGKFKYIGLTTHKEMKGCMENALKQGFYNALMPSYNFLYCKGFLHSYTLQLHRVPSILSGIHYKRKKEEL